VVRRTEAAVALEASSPQLKRGPTQLVGFGSDTLPRSWFLSRRRGGVVNAYSLQSSHLTISSPLDFTGWLVQRLSCPVTLTESGHSSENPRLEHPHIGQIRRGVTSGRTCEIGVTRV
jgi:hypothetical protein